MIRSILLVLGSRFEEGGQLQEPPPFADSYKAEHSLLSYTDAKATEQNWMMGKIRRKPIFDGKNHGFLVSARLQLMCLDELLERG